MATPDELKIPYNRFSVVLANIGDQVSVPEDQTPIYFNLHLSGARSSKTMEVVKLGRDFIEDFLNTLLEIAKEQDYEELSPSSLPESIIIDLARKKKTRWRKEERLSLVRIKINSTFWGNELNLELSISAEEKAMLEELESIFSTRFDISKYTSDFYSLTFIPSSVTAPYTHTSVSHVSFQAIETRYSRIGDKIRFSTTTEEEKKKKKRHNGFYSFER